MRNMKLNKPDIESLKLSEMKLESVPNYIRETILATIFILVIIVALVVLIGIPSLMWLFYVIITLGFFIGIYDYFCFNKKIHEINKIKTDIKLRIRATKFRYWRDKALPEFFKKKFVMSDTGIKDEYYEKLLDVIAKSPMNNAEGNKQISNNIFDKHGKYKKIWCLNTEDKGYNTSSVLIDSLLPIYLNCCVNSFMCDKSRNFVLDERLSPLFNFKDGFYLQYIRCFMILSIYCHTPEILLLLLSNEARYNFFKKFHKILETNLEGDDKNLFYDYLNSCRKIILKSKDNNNDLCDKQRAIEVFDLKKVRNLEEPEQTKISTLDLNKNKNTIMSNSSEINTNELSGALKLKPIATEKNTSDQKLSSTTKNLF